jgi:hypothetical protein
VWDVLIRATSRALVIVINEGISSLQLHREPQ